MTVSTTVRRALTQGPAALGPADTPALRHYHLSGWAYAQLPPENPLRAALRPEALALSARHALIRREVRELLAAWNAEALPSLLIKGFALAEFEYGLPAERFYGDVDILVPEDNATIQRMVHLALARGWRSDGQYADPKCWTHECGHLLSPSGQTWIDIHRFVVGWHGGSARASAAHGGGVARRTVRRLAGPQDTAARPPRPPGGERGLWALLGRRRWRPQTRRLHRLRRSH